MSSEPNHLPPPSGDLDSPEIQFLSALWETWQALVTAGEQELRASHGLNLRTFLTLSYLQGGPQHPADLACEVGVPRYEISRVLAALDGLGAITRERSGSDGRGVVVRITPLGRQRWAAALQTVRAVTGPPLAHLDARQQQETIAGLQAVARAAQGPPSLPTSSSDSPSHPHLVQEQL